MMVNYKLKQYREEGVDVHIAGVMPPNKVGEFQVMLNVLPSVGDFGHQLRHIGKVLSFLFNEHSLKNARPLFARFFLSDVVNQQKEMLHVVGRVLSCPVSYIQQPPLDGSKIAVWIQMQTSVSPAEGFPDEFEHNGYVHSYFTSRPDVSVHPEASYVQTHILLREYENRLKQSGCTLAENCLRTWFFVRDIDCDYPGVVEARKAHFELRGLSPDTHFIASTGIQGGTVDNRTRVLMDGYAIKGLKAGQIRFLYASEYMSRTYDYGVTFERGVAIDFGDRRKVLISGTASIDRQGAVVHPGNVELQVLRMWSNVEALLKEADCSFDDMMQIIVYLRDIGDYRQVVKMFDSKFANVPRVIVLAPVCRPGWLVEMECIAVKAVDNPQFKDL
ncbi:MAG: hypothetical protein H6Q17_280 [Bacteroidetes bacterium]|nr:hypothetical protein [Bacteroidota bacterium]